MNLEDLLELCADSASGLVWKISPNRRIKAGTPALVCKNSNGYYAGSVCGQKYLAHRVVWFLSKGYWPSEVDHIDGDRGNNRLSNLRAVTHSANMQNKRQVRGYHKTDRGYRASIGYNGITYYLGTFATESEAKAAYLEAKRTLHTSVPESYYAA